MFSCPKYLMHFWIEAFDRDDHHDTKILLLTLMAFGGTGKTRVRPLEVLVKLSAMPITSNNAHLCTYASCVPNVVQNSSWKQSPVFRSPGFLSFIPRRPLCLLPQGS